MVLGAFVTCYGRMVLYEELYKLDNRILYYDTDSIIFLSKDEACYEPQLGDLQVKLKSKMVIISLNMFQPDQKIMLINLTVEKHFVKSKASL